MKRFASIFALVALSLSGVAFGQVATSPSVAGEQVATMSPAESAIRKVVKDYVAAFNSGNAEALSNFWADDAVYTNKISGESVQGRTAIREQFTTLFAERKGLKLDVSIESIQFLSPSVASEHGVAKFMTANSEPELIQYSAIYVKRGDSWLLDRVADEEHPDTNSNYKHLKSLEWMVGKWASANDTTDVTVECTWTANRNFMTRAFALTTQNETFSGMQIIGWDAAKNTIRSWTFDSNGTFAEATWGLKGDQWIIRNVGVLPDGRKASMVNVMKMVDENSFSWKTIERTAGDELLPNLAEVIIHRQ